MTHDELVELMGAGAHEAWMDYYRGIGVTSRLSHEGEEFMVPWDQLSEHGKNLDRVIMRGILRQFDSLGLKVVRA